MLFQPTRFWFCFVFGGMGLFAASLAGQEITKSRFKVVTFAELTMAPDKNETSTVLLESLNKLGKAGWEAMAEGEKGVVFRESPRGITWEYRMVRAPESTLNARSDDDEVLQLVLDGLSVQGWDLCLGRALDGKSMVFKRTKDRYYDKETKKASIDVPVRPPQLVIPDIKPPMLPSLPSFPSDAKK